MSILRTASHWNHTACESCMEKHGLTKPSRSRPAAGPCCFCGGKRPDELRGRAPAGVTCNGMRDQPVAAPTPVTPTFLEPVDEPPVMPEIDVPVVLRAPEERPPLRTQEEAPRRTRRLVRPKQRKRGGRLQVEAKAPELLLDAEAPPAKKVAAKKTVAQKKAEEEAAAVRKWKNPQENMSPEKRAEMEKKRLYAAAIVKFAEWAIKGKADRGRDEQFSFVTVKPKANLFRYGEAGAHIHRGEGSWVGRKAETTHLPKRSLLIIDRETHQSVAMVTRWRCGGFATFSRFTKGAKYKVCPKCLKSEKWNNEMAARRAAKQKEKEKA